MLLAGQVENNVMSVTYWPGLHNQEVAGLRLEQVSGVHPGHPPVLQVVLAALIEKPLLVLSLVLLRCYLFIYFFCFFSFFRPWGLGRETKGGDVLFCTTDLPARHPNTKFRSQRK